MYSLQGGETKKMPWRDERCGCDLMWETKDDLMRSERNQRTELKKRRLKDKIRDRVERRVNIVIDENGGREQEEVTVRWNKGYMCCTYGIELNQAESKNHDLELLGDCNSISLDALVE